MPPTTDPQLPLTIVILCYSAVILLAIILLMLFRISGQLAMVAFKLSKSSRPSRTRETEVAPATPESAPAHSIEVGAGTAFEEFLNEDPQRRNLPKKEQFKEYRKWRAAKGLNWAKP